MCESLAFIVISFVDGDRMYGFVDGWQEQLGKQFPS